MSKLAFLNGWQWKLPALLAIGLAAGSAFAEPSTVPCQRLGHWGKCIAVPLASPQEDLQAKRFLLPAPDKAKVYIVRPGTMEPLAKSAMMVDGKTVAELGPMTFGVLETDAGLHHFKIHTEPESEITFDLVPGKIHYVEYRFSHLLNSVSGTLVPLDERTGQSLVLKSKLVATME